jgi:cytochrome c peroxidase
MTAQNVAKAIGAFERTLVTSSPFDDHLAGHVDALSPTGRARMVPPSGDAPMT